MSVLLVCIEQVHQIVFDDDNNVINKNVFLHGDGEIWGISASPLDADVFATIYNTSVYMYNNDS